MNAYVSLENAKNIIEHLSIADKIRLIEMMLPDIKRELSIKEITKKTIKIKGLWKDINLSDEEILENRQIMWQIFPREDI